MPAPSVAAAPDLRGRRRSGTTVSHPCATVERMFAWLDTLNDEQRAAATYDGGALRIVAGAGTGKTTTLTSRVAWLVGTGTPADRVLLLTFTRRAAREMVART